MTQTRCKAEKEAGEKDTAPKTMSPIAKKNTMMVDLVTFMHSL